MRDRPRSFAAIGLALVLVAGCGGGAATTQPAASQPSQPGATSGAAPSDGGPAPSTGERPSTAPEPGGNTQPPTTGGGGVCDLVTATELEGVFGTSGITTRTMAGPPDTCDIQLDNAPLAATVYTVSGGRMVFDILAAGADAEAIDGIGDDAFYSAGTVLLVVAKGDKMLSISVFDDGRSEDQRLGLMRQIGSIAAGRM